jgi:hypothetical protein
MHTVMGGAGRRLLTALTFLSVLGAAGCGSSSSGTVTGKVTYKGAAVPGGTVSFFGADNWTGSAHLGEDGSYSIANVPAGTVRISVETMTARPPKPPPGAMPKPPTDAPVPKGSMYDPAAQAKRYVPIPPRYADKDQSGLTYDVKPGKQVHDIKLD